MSRAALQKLSGWRATPTAAVRLPDCSLVVPTWQRPVEIISLLEVLVGLADAPGEVIVVDGSPDNASRELIEAWAVGAALPFALVYIGSPPGLTRQRNVGLDAARGDYIFFLDDDCVPLPGYFQAIRAVFVADVAAAIGAVRGFIVNGASGRVPLLWQLRAALGIVGTEPGKYYPTGMSWTWNKVTAFTGTRPIDVLAGGAAAYRRAVFARHRFSAFFSGYAAGEDLEMSRRVAQGWQLVVCGDARLCHNHAATGRPGGFALARMVVRNRYFIWQRHSPAATASDRFKFWLDHALVGATALVQFFGRPWQPAALGRALGTVCGSVECLLAPPHYVEPPVQKEYEFRMADLRQPSCNW